MDINIRSVKVDDYIDISKIRKMEGVENNILATSDEQTEKMKSKIMNITPNDFWFVAEKDGKVIGVSILNRYSNPRKKHVASITVMVDSDYHSKGVGTLLMKELIKLSDNILKLKRLELQVFIDNENAIKLYKKFGFVKEGLQKYSALKNDVYTDELMMARIYE
ncbi:GNAT family N-acetyltransferase [uncultured Clostridium sp.]|uniref:GNAT family N-acetyltransferase n=1 Tax=uncultured Clostridium sp. TaxID=59620 RepID=UPI002621B24E|nr:GNAT family N-acetyltransferase [uncultured Clostridium sp.]